MKYMSSSPHPRRLITLLFGLLVLAAIGIDLIRRSNESLNVIDHPSSSIEAPTSTREQPSTSSSTTKHVLDANASVIRVVDGDTFVARLDNDGEWKIRMLGMNTPETVDPRKPVQCFGKQASQKLHDLLEGKRIRLEADPQADERDKYGRLLRNVYLIDGTDVNAFMVREGYAYAYLSFPLNRERKAQLKQLENQARASSTGLWSKDACPVSIGS